MVTVKRILAGIGCPQLTLHRDKTGYFYFVYDDPRRNIFETESVYTYRLSRMPIADWIELGRAFVDKVESR